VPDLGDFENVEVIEVLVAAGDAVKCEDGLVTIETDKASMDIPAPENGVIEKLTIGIGDTVSTGDVIGRMTVEFADTVVIPADIAATDIDDASPTAAPSVETQPDESPEPAGKQTLVVPDLGDFSDVEIIEVHVGAGDQVEVEDPLITLETDKAAMDVPAVVAGTIETVLVSIGDKVSEGGSIATIDAVALAPVAQDPGSAPVTSPKPSTAVSPAAAPAPARSPPRQSMKPDSQKRMRVRPCANSRANWALISSRSKVRVLRVAYCMTT
jgi:pyruvate dehydrogenase E2 component (dihydrolipoamide acetyltransferase)